MEIQAKTQVHSTGLKVSAVCQESSRALSVSTVLAIPVLPSFGGWVVEMVSSLTMSFYFVILKVGTMESHWISLVFTKVVLWCWWGDDRQRILLSCCVALHSSRDKHCYFEVFLNFNHCPKIINCTFHFAYHSF